MIETGTDRFSRLIGKLKNKDLGWKPPKVEIKGPPVKKAGSCVGQCSGGVMRCLLTTEAVAKKRLEHEVQ